MPGLTPYHKNKWIIAATLAAIIVILLNLDSAPHFVEYAYSEGLYKGVSFVQHLLFGWLPFSLGDVLYVLTVIWLLYIVVKAVYLLIKARFANAGWLMLKLIIGIETGIVIFYLFWGLKLFPPAPRQNF